MLNQTYIKRQTQKLCMNTEYAEKIEGEMPFLNGLVLSSHRNYLVISQTERVDNNNHVLYRLPFYNKNPLEQSINERMKSTLSPSPVLNHRYLGKRNVPPRK